MARPHIERLARTIPCETGVLVAVDDHEVTTALSAFGGGAEMQEPLGERIPLMPPLGEAYVACRPEVVEHGWPTRRPATRRRGEVPRRLADVRERGYAVVTPRRRTPTTTSRRRCVTTQRVGHPGQRAVRSVISQTSPFFETLDIDAAQTYDLGSIVVPVLGPDAPRARRSVTQLPQGVDGRQVGEWIAGLQFAAGSVGRALAAREREGHPDYAAPFGRDFMM